MQFYVTWGCLVYECSNFGSGWFDEIQALPAPAEGSSFENTLQEMLILDSLLHPCVMAHWLAALLPALSKILVKLFAQDNVTY